MRRGAGHRRVLADPHLRERGTIFDLDHPTPRPVRDDHQPAAPVGFAGEARRAPLYGEHTDEVLTTLAGYTPDDVKRLREKGVLQ